MDRFTHIIMFMVVVIAGCITTMDAFAQGDPQARSAAEADDDFLRDEGANDGAPYRRELPSLGGDTGRGTSLDFEALAEKLEDSTCLRDHKKVAKQMECLETFQKENFLTLREMLELLRRANTKLKERFEAYINKQHEKDAAQDGRLDTLEQGKQAQDVRITNLENRGGGSSWLTPGVALGGGLTCHMARCPSMYVNFRPMIGLGEHFSFEGEVLGGTDFKYTMLGFRAGFMVHLQLEGEWSFGLRGSFVGYGLEDQASAGPFWDSTLLGELVVRVRFVDKRREGGLYLELFGGPPGKAWFDSTRMSRDGLTGGGGFGVGYQF